VSSTSEEWQQHFCARRATRRSPVDSGVDACGPGVHSTIHLIVSLLFSFLLVLI
jgi:hypothetical protein